VHPQVRWVLVCQLLVTLAAGLVAGLALGFDAAVSAVLGGGIAMASAFAYAWRALRLSGQVDAKKSVSGPGGR
jgi:F0F1-type ATP synthase assembly protein I